MKTSLLIRQKFLLPFFCAGLLMIASNGHTQTVNAKEKVLQSTHEKALKKMERKFKKEARREKSRAIKMAREKGWIIRKEFKDGRIMELMGVRDNGKPLYYITSNTDAAGTISTDDVHPGGSFGLDLDGTGMIVGEWDGGAVLTMHQEFRNTGTMRVTQKDNSSSTSNHATHVAGTMIAGGVDPNAKGMAYNAHLHAYDWDYDESEMAEAASNGLLLSNHSYGFSAGWYLNDGEWEWAGDEGISTEEDYRFGFYGSYCEDYDNIAFNAPYYLIVKSAGNDRGDGPADGDHPVDGGLSGFDCLGYWGNAKNILTVAAVRDLPEGYQGNPGDVNMTYFSSWGPSDDGRIKPDISANGYTLYSTSHSSNDSYTSMSGTSMASPSATGSLLLLQEYYFELLGEYMKASTLKALAIHTADEAGSHPGPDYKFGWGLMNTRKAADVISSNGSNTYILEESLAEGTTWSTQVKATGNDSLIVTVVWTDPAGKPVQPQLDPRDTMLVNDLDVRVTDTDTTFFPYKLDPVNPASAATTGDNGVDNVEKIYIDNPEKKTYTITVSHKGTLENQNQDFSIIVSGIASVDNDMTPKNISLTGEDIKENWMFPQAVYPTVKVKNLGLNAQDTFSLELSVLDTNQTQVYNSSLIYSGDSLSSGEDILLTMPDAWSNQVAGMYKLQAAVKLTVDQNPANDTTYRNFEVVTVQTYNDSLAYAWNSTPASGNQEGLYLVNKKTGLFTLLKASTDQFYSSASFTKDSLLMGIQSSSNAIHFINADGSAYPYGNINNLRTITGMSVNQQNGLMYVAEWNSNAGETALYRINKDFTTEQKGTIINGLLLGIAFDYAGNLYGLGYDNNLYSIDTASGTGTIIGDLGVEVAAYYQEIEYDINNGVLYGALYTGTEDNETGGVYTINTKTGKASQIKEYGDQLTAFALQWTQGPHIKEKYPADTSLNNPDATLWATFDVVPEEVDLSGVTIDGSSNVSASLSNDTLFIDHDPFTLGNVYKVTIPAGAVKDQNASLQKDVSWHFRAIQTYSIDFQVTDSTNSEPLDSARVKIANNTYLTDSTGTVSIELPVDSYDYEIVANDYVSSAGSINLNQDTTIHVELTPLYTVTFIVTDENDNSLSYALVKIVNRSITTDTQGEASIVLEPGTYDYTVSRSLYQDYSDQISVDSSMNVDVVLSLAANSIENLFAKDLTVYPNPTKGLVVISCEELKGSKITVRSVSGKSIRTYQAEEMEKKVHLNGLPEGVYILEIEKGKQKISKKVILEK